MESSESPPVSYECSVDSFRTTATSPLPHLGTADLNLSVVVGIALGMTIIATILTAAAHTDVCHALSPELPSPSMTVVRSSVAHPLTLHASNVLDRAPPSPATFTPSSFHSSRRPPLSSPKGAVVSLYTGYGYGGDQWFRQQWPDNERNFFAPFASHVHWVVFYLRWPTIHNAYDAFHTSINRREAPLNWTLLAPADRVILPLDDPSYPLTDRGEEYLTPLGARVLLMPLILNLPQWIADDPGLLDRPGWRTCTGRAWDMDYIMYSGAAYVWHVLQHPLLRRYDYVLKSDLDNRWVLQPPESPFEHMARKGCVWMHSNKGGPEDCGVDAFEAVNAWAADRHVVPQSDGQPFMHVESFGNFAGNFIGGWMGWLGSEENLDLARFLYEDRRYPGYFQRRWTDQPAWSIMLGTFHKLTVDEFLGKNGSAVCDLESWRGKYFVHKG